MGAARSTGRGGDTTTCGVPRPHLPTPNPTHCTTPLRFCTEKYSLSSKNLKNRFGHLTNYSVNKKNDAFGRNVDAEADGEGSKWSLQALLRWFRDNGIDDVAVREPGGCVWMVGGVG